MLRQKVIDTVLLDAFGDEIEREFSDITRLSGYEAKAGLGSIAQVLRKPDVRSKYPDLVSFLEDWNTLHKETIESRKSENPERSVLASKVVIPSMEMHKAKKALADRRADLDKRKIALGKKYGTWARTPGRYLSFLGKLVEANEAGDSFADFAMGVNK